jgi:hypothetical protein
MTLVFVKEPKNSTLVQLEICTTSKQTWFTTQTFCEFLEGNDWIPPPLMIGCA